ncbi:MAG: hypothetical protein V7K88_30765 [Nostoc sp.]|uniref:hypothetical protein n=1 Tax=Nostoc sp. TaxID=1180 RepID=UPI002FF4F38A
MQLKINDKSNQFWILDFGLPRLRYNSWRGCANGYALLYERLRQRRRSGQAQDKLSTSRYKSLSQTILDNGIENLHIQNVYRFETIQTIPIWNHL